MATDVLQSTTPTFTFRPATRWASATGRIVDAAGTSVGTLTPTLPTPSTTVTAAASAYQLTLASGSGLTPGMRVLIQESGQSSTATIETVDVTAVTLTAPLAWTPSLGATVKALDVTAVPTAALTTLGVNYRAIVEDATGLQEVAWFNVVRTLFKAPATEESVRDIVAHGFTSAHLLRQPEVVRSVASRACQMVRDRLAERASWPHLTGDPTALEEVGRVATRIVLFEDFALTPPNRDQDTYQRHLASSFSALLNGLVHRLGGYDADDDGGLISEVEEAASVSTIRLVA